MTAPEEKSDPQSSADLPEADLHGKSVHPISGTQTDVEVSVTSDQEQSDVTGKFFFPMPGEKLGKYEVQSVLGNGGMGVVFQAWDPDLQRSVAIKILGPQLALSKRARRRFLREARAAASISHPNVVTVHAVEQHDDVPYMVMERVVGKTLKAYIADHGPLTGIDAVRISHQIALGLAAAHAQGVIHRDVKPGNVMIEDGTNRVRITDFGLARAVIDNQDLTSMEHAVGTPAYMSPEQVQGTRLDSRSDLFGFGCLIYFMFTRQSPFQGRVTADTWERVLNEHPQRLDELHPAAPPLLAEIAMRLLEKNPANRIQSAAAVASELERFLSLLNQASSDQIESLLKDTHAPNIASAGVIGSKSDPAASTTSRPQRLWLSGFAALLLIAGMLVGSSSILPFFSTETNPSVIVTNVTNPPVLEAPLSKLSSIRVGEDVQSDCRTITEALQRAAQPCVITVAGPATVYESVIIDGAGFNGLRLVAEGPVTWSCPDGSNAPPLRLGNVRDVTVSGFDFDIQRVGAHGVEVVDNAENVLIERCTFEHTISLPKLSLLWISANTGDWEKRLRVRDCSFRCDGQTSFCISISNGPSSGSHVEVVGCQFRARAKHLYITDSCGQLRLTNCLFIDGINAVNLSLTDCARNYPIDMVNNTFYGVRFWLSLMDSFRAGEASVNTGGGEIVNNLILGGERTLGGEDQFQHLLEYWRVEANWWERSSATRSNADRNGRLATLVDNVDLVQRTDADEPGFLVPLADSPLATAGVGESWEDYIGALPPSSQF